MQQPAQRTSCRSKTAPPIAARLWLIVGVTSALLAAVALCISSRAHAADGGSRTAHRVVLSPENLDRVTAGGVSFRIDADAVARGTTAFTDAFARFEVTYGQALRVHVDPPPDPRPPYVMGPQELAVTRGSGRAYASGDQGADCSVNATVMIADLLASMVNSIKAVTATAALCQCSLLAVSVMH